MPFLCVAFVCSNGCSLFTATVVLRLRQQLFVGSHLTVSFVQFLRVFAQVVYVATVHALRHNGVAAAHRHGKACLVENPMTINLRMAQAMIDQAREAKLFLMEVSDLYVEVEVMKEFSARRGVSK